MLRACPNVVLIVNDEERDWDTIESLLPDAPARERFRAMLPARMRLRRGGVRFRNHHTPVAPCSPARSVLYTGHHAPDTQVVDNLNFAVQESLRPETPTTADVMGAAGYYCAYKGKVHLSHELDVSSNSATHTTVARRMRDRYGFRDFQGIMVLGDVEGPKAGYSQDPDTARNAACWLAHRAPRIRGPWLLAVNFVNPHDVMMVDVDGVRGVQQTQSRDWPLVPVPDDPVYWYWWNPRKPVNFPGETGYTPGTQGPRPQMLDEWASLLSAVFGNVPFEDHYRTHVKVYRDPQRPELGTRRLNVPLWQAYLNYYLNCLVDNDRHIGSVLDAVVSGGHADSTIVVFTADHGELAMSHMGESRYFDEAMTDGAPPDPETTRVMPLRQKGGFVYRENLNVPLVFARLTSNPAAPAAAWLPAVGVDVPVLSSSVDVLATLAAVAGLTPRRYETAFGDTLASLGMRRTLPGASLHNVLAAPGRYRRPQWRDGRGNGRDAVLFTYDAPSTVDADVAYETAQGTCAEGSDWTKRGMLRGFFDGRRKFARYFSALDHAVVNSAEAAAGDYAGLTSLGHGQDLQVFDSAADPGERCNVADRADVGALNSVLYDLMARELADPPRTPDTVAAALSAPACPEG